MSDLPTAAQARILSANNRALRTEGELMRLRTRISQALERGQSSITVQPCLSTDARRRLEALGYTVSTYVPTQQEGEWTPHDTVRW